MLLEPGKVYHFTFNIGLDPAEPADGFYTVLQKLTYAEMRNLGDSDYPESYKDRVFLKLQAVISEDIVFVPDNDGDESTVDYISGYPNSDVAAYPRLVLALSLGPVTSASPLQALRERVLDSVNNYGDWEPTYTMEDIRLVKSGERWAKRVDLDGAGVRTSPTPSPNPYTENRLIKQENAQLRLRVMELETAIQSVFNTSS